MAQRTFALQKRLSENSGGSIADIPNTGILRYAPPDEILELFKMQWGTRPEAIMLPVVNADGPLFPVAGLGEPLSKYATGFSGGLKDFQDIVFSFARKGIDVYLSIDPRMSFISTAPMQIVDIVGDSARHICIGNSRSQDMIAAVLGTGIDIALETTKDTRGKLKGIAVDVVDLWPMGGVKNRLELTCFCPSCEQFLADAKPGLLRQFKTFPNPWNLLLNALPTGIDHISEIRLHYGPEDIVGLSRQKAFHEAFGTDSTAVLLEYAKAVLQYIEARHNQVLFAIQQIFTQALEGLDNPPRRILLTEGLYYSWTGGLQLERLDVSTEDTGAIVPYDEVWFDAKSNQVAFKNVDFRSYMARRSRYYLDHFFDIAAGMSNPESRVFTGVGRLSTGQMKELLRTRLLQALGSLTTGQTSLSALSDLKTDAGENRRVGYIGVALTREIGEKFIEGLHIAPGGTDEIAIPAGDNMAEFLRQLMARQEQPE